MMKWTNEWAIEWMMKWVIESMIESMMKWVMKWTIESMIGSIDVNGCFHHQMMVVWCLTRNKVVLDVFVLLE